MSVNLGFAQASSDFLTAALLIYSLAVIAFAGDYAFGRPRRTAAAKAAKAAVPATAQLATVGAGSAGGASVAETAAQAATAVPAAPAPARGQARSRPSGQRDRGSVPPWRSARSARSRTWWR